MEVTARPFRTATNLAPDISHAGAEKEFVLCRHILVELKLANEKPVIFPSRLKSGPALLQSCRTASCVSNRFSQAFRPKIHPDCRNDVFMNFRPIPSGPNN